MKFGVMCVPAGWKGTTDQEIYNQVIEQAEAAEALGFDEVWLTEHHFTDYGRPGISPLLAAIAMRTKRVRIGASVFVPLLHHPIDVAEDAAVVDILSGGRLDAGVGRGFHSFELEGFGVDPATSRERHNEAVEIIRRAWCEGEIEYQGEFWQIPRREFRPLPLQKPHPPIFQPIRSQVSFEELARDGRNPIFGAYMTTLKRVDDAYATWNQTLDRLGLSPSAFQDMCSVIVHVGETDAEAQRNCADSLLWNKGIFEKQIPEENTVMRRQFGELTLERIYDDGSFIGSPETVARKVKWLQELGASQLACLMNFADMDHQAVLRSMELFAHHVIPQFRD